MFDPADAKFWPSKEFGELGTYALDPKTKTITTSSVGGMAGMIHRFATYKVENNAPVLMHLEVQDWDESKQQFHCVVEERRDGKMTVVRDVWGAELVKGDLPRPPCQ